MIQFDIIYPLYFFQENVQKKIVIKHKKNKDCVYRKLRWISNLLLLFTVVFWGNGCMWKGCQFLIVSILSGFEKKGVLWQIQENEADLVLMLQQLNYSFRFFFFLLLLLVVVKWVTMVLTWEEERCRCSKEGGWEGFLWWASWEVEVGQRSIGEKVIRQDISHLQLPEEAV